MNKLKTLIGYFLLISAVLVIAESAGAKVKPKPKPKPPKGHLEKGIWQQLWTTEMATDLNASDLLKHEEKQITDLCPAYANDTNARMMFWQQLMMSLSWKESLYGPANWVSFRGGKNVGLFQISPTLRTYYDCKDYDLFDPIKNIGCAVKMAKNLVARFGTFLSGTKEGMAAYWQPLRATSTLNKNNRAFILADVKQACSSKLLVYHDNEKHFGEDANPLEDPEFTPNTTDDLGIPQEELEPLSLLDLD